MAAAGFRMGETNQTRQDENLRQETGQQGGEREPQPGPPGPRKAQKRRRGWGHGEGEGEVGETHRGKDKPR